MENKTIYACKEHVELALDDYVNNYEAAPEMLSVSDEKCSYCNNDAQYLIS